MSEIWPVVTTAQMLCTQVVYLGFKKKKKTPSLEHLKVQKSKILLLK